MTSTRAITKIARRWFGLLLTPTLAVCCACGSEPAPGEALRDAQVRTCDPVSTPTPDATIPGSAAAGVVGTPPDTDAIAAVLQHDYADAYASLKVCDATMLEIFRIPNRGLDEDALQAQFPDVVLIFSAAELSEADGEVIIGEVITDSDAWAADGVRITTLHADERGRVVVGIRGKVTGDIRAAFVERYGPYVDVERSGGVAISLP